MINRKVHTRIFKLFVYIPSHDHLEFFGGVTNLANGFPDATRRAVDIGTLRMLLSAFRRWILL